MSFQDELKENLRSFEEVQKEVTQRETDYMMMKANNSLHDIKNKLIESAKYARTETQNGITSVFCYYELPHYYMNIRMESNINQLKQDQQKFVLFRDPNLTYHTWSCYEVSPNYSTEFWQYISTLKELASKENISIEPVVYNYKENRAESFPSKLPNNHNLSWRLHLKATSVISIDEDYLETQQTVTSTSTYEYQVENINSNRKTTSTQYMKSSDGEIIVKSIIVILFCLIAFLICFSGNFGQLGMALLLIGVAFLGYKIMETLRL